MMLEQKYAGITKKSERCILGMLILLVVFVSVSLEGIRINNGVGRRLEYGESGVVDIVQRDYGNITQTNSFVMGDAIGIEKRVVSSPRNGYQKGLYVNIKTRFEYVPQQVIFLYGNLVYGDLVSLHRGDGKSIVIYADTTTNEKRIEMIFVFPHQIDGIVFLRADASKNISGKIYVYDYNLGGFVEKLSWTSIRVINVSIDARYTDRVKLLATGALEEDYNLSIYYLVELEPDIDIDIPYRYVSEHELEYILSINSAPAYTKIYMVNLSEFWWIKRIDPWNTVWNFTEQSITIPNTNNVSIVFGGYDYWLRMNPINVSLKFRCADRYITADDIRVIYKVWRINYTISNTNYTFQHAVLVENPNTYDLYNVSVRIEINDSWFNMLALAWNIMGVKFLENESGNLTEVPAYLDFWDGRIAQFYIKMDKILSRERKVLIILYGGSENISSSFDPRAKVMGPISSISDLADGRNWIEYADNVEYILLANNTVDITMEEYNGNPMLWFKHIVSGVYETRMRFTVRSSSSIILNDFRWGMALVSKDYSTRYQIIVENDTQLNLFCFIIRASDSSEYIRQKYFEPPSAPPYYFEVDIKINEIAGFIEIYAEFLNVSLKLETCYANFEDILDISKIGWRIEYFAYGITKLSVDIYNWSQRIGMGCRIVDWGDEKFRANITETYVSGSDWWELSEETIIIPESSKILFVITDVLGNTISSGTIERSNISYEPLIGPVIYLNVSASILVLKNSASRKSCLEIWHQENALQLEIYPYSRREIVLAHTYFYIWGQYDSDSHLWKILIYLSGGTVVLDVGSIWSLIESVDSFDGGEVIFVSVPLYTSQGASAEGMYSFVVRYGYILEYITTTLNSMLTNLSGLWDTYVGELMDDDLDIPHMLEVLNITLDGKPRVVQIQSDGNKTKVIVGLESGATEEYIIPDGILEIFKVLLNENVSSMVFLDKHAKNLIRTTDIIDICVNASDQSIHMRAFFGSEILSLYIDIAKSMIEIFAESASPLIGFISNVIQSPLLFLLFANRRVSRYLPRVEGASTHLTIYMLYKYIYIYMSSTNAYQVDCLYDLANYRCVIVDEISGTRVDVDLKRKFVSYGNNIFDVNDTYCSILVDTIRGGLKLIIASTRFMVPFKAWIEENIVYRQVIIRNYYTNETISGYYTFLNLYINGSSEASGEEIITLSGTVNVSVISMWGDKLYENWTANETIIVYIRVSVLLIVNELNTSICVLILSSNGENITVDVGPDSIYSVLLSLNTSYNIRIFVEDKEILNRTLSLDEKGSEQPLYAIIVSDELLDENNARSTSGHEKGTNNTSPNFDPGGVIKRYYWIPLIVVGIILVLKIVRKLRRRKIIEIEEIIRNIADEETVV